MRATWSTDPPGGNTATNLMGCLLGQACAQVHRGKLAANTAPVMQTVRFIQETVMWESLSIDVDQESICWMCAFSLQRIPLS
jgi:hypothetical protein